MVDDARQYFIDALHSDDHRRHRTIASKLSALPKAELDACDVSAFYESLDEFDDAFLTQLCRHSDDSAFIEVTAYLVTMPKAKSTRDFCFAKLCQSESHSPLLLALLESDPERALKRLRAFEEEDGPAAQILRLRIAFDGLLNGGEQTIRSWHILQNAGFDILSTPLHSDDERESLVWLTRLSDIDNKPETIAPLFAETLQKSPKERHRLLCAFVAHDRTHAFLAQGLALKNESVLTALLDTLCDAVDIKEWQGRWDFAEPLLSAIQSHAGVAALAPLKRMLASYSVCAQRHRDKPRQREIAQLLRPVALHFEEHKRPYAQSFDVRQVLKKRRSVRGHLRLL